jgi:hypothetical protein
MSNEPLPTLDPVELVRQLDPDVIRARLEEMESERKALLTLLRAALAKRGRDQQSPKPRPRKVVASD